MPKEKDAFSGKIPKYENRKIFVIFKIDNKKHNMKLLKEDIKKIGHTLYQENNCLCVCCNIELSNIEEIFLRNILNLFGEEYHIIAEEEYFEGNGDITHVFKTNLPYNYFEEL